MPFFRPAFIILGLLLFTQPAHAQQKGYKPIKEDSAFEPYVRFDEDSGDYIIGYMRSATTGKIYETLYVPPTKVVPVFHVKTTREERIFTYDYELVNTSDSKQDISSFEFQLKGAIRELILPELWYRLGNRFAHKILTRPKFEEGEPIEFDSDLQTGDTLSFTLKSSFPPSIITAFVSGRPKRLSFHFVHPPSPEVRKISDSLRTQVADHRGVEVKTLGFMPPSSPFDAKKFLNDRINMISKASELNWIGGREFIHELKQQIEMSSNFLAGGDTIRAIQSIKWLVQMVDYVREGHESNNAFLTGEGYALLYYNSRYLRERLLNETEH